MTDTTDDLQRLMAAVDAERAAMRFRCARCGDPFRVGSDVCARCSRLDPDTLAALSREVRVAIEASPQIHSDPMLHAVTTKLRDGADPARVLAAALVAYAEDRARLLKIARDAAIFAPLPPFGVKVKP